MPVAKLIPMPVIAAILFVVAYNMSEWRAFVAVLKSKRVGEIAALIVTFVLTVVLNLVYAIIAGIIVTLIFWIIHKIGEKKKAKQNA